ncbi:hypothetical protein LH612_35460, partial [Klebsiella pneumoniae]|nr:hypothetical protein [Klebsiella pneumoniae]
TCGSFAASGLCFSNSPGSACRLRLEIPPPELRSLPSRVDLVLENFFPGRERDTCVVIDEHEKLL